MEKRVQVVVDGSSLSMAGIAASLSPDAGLEVVRIDPHSPTFRKQLAGLDPGVVAFDPGDPSSGLDVRLLRGRYKPGGQLPRTGDAEMGRPTPRLHAGCPALARAP
ncbi:MAG TPA: hypothetical protein PKO09_10395 [Anaerolineae bacterium]|nr:hypothetical protein [Anaerolineae bacterium]